MCAAVRLACTACSPGCHLSRPCGLHRPAGAPACRYVANHTMCQFPLLAAELAAAGLSSFRFDHPCAILSRSQRRGPFLMGNHEEEVQDMRDAVDFLQGSLGKRVVCLLGHRCGPCVRGAVRDRCTCPHTASRAAQQRALALPCAARGAQTP